MEAKIQELAVDPAALRGLSANLLLSHHRNNYGGAVKRLNAIRAQLAALDVATAPGFKLNGLKREELVAANSMRLHELYFASLGGDGTTMTPAMSLALDASFGSVARWRAEFAAMGKALGGGSGWVLLTFMPGDGSLVNAWCADHTHSLAGGVYVDAFMANVDWAGVYERYQSAVDGASDAFGVGQEELSGATLFDVRRAGMFEKADALIPGASWRDPAAVAAWSAEVPVGAEVVVYCVYGHEVGRATALRLRSQGIAARFLRGGIDGWKAAGRPLQAKAGRPD